MGQIHHSTMTKFSNNLRHRLTGINGEWMRICGESNCLPQQNTFHVQATSDPTPRQYNTNLTGVSVSDNANVLRAETRFHSGRLLLAQERFLNAPAECRYAPSHELSNYPQRFYAPTSRSYEQLDLLIDSDEFYIPTGGASSNGSPWEYDWDIYINHNYWKTFRGFSGSKSTGIKVQKPKDLSFKSDVFLYRDKNIADIRSHFHASIPIKARLGYKILPFYVQETSSGTLNKCILGTPPNISLTSENDKIKVAYRSTVKQNTEKNHIPRIWQYVAICPQGNNLSRADIQTYLLYLSVPDLWDKRIDVQTLFGSSCVTDFAAHVLNEQSYVPCTGFEWVMPVAGYAQCYSTPIPNTKMLVSLRPNAQYPPQQAWLRAFGFNANSESFEIWNRQANKNLVLAVSGILTPEMVCDGKCDSAGHHAFRSWFDGCSYLEKADLRFHHSWNNVKTCGDYFGLRMFANCVSLKEFSSDWTEPLGFESVGHYHNVNKYMNCKSLIHVSKSYNESHNIKEAGIGYGSYQFEGCTNLVSPSRFYTEPRTFDNTPPAINSYKFAGCTNLTDFIQYTETRIQGSNPQAYLAGKFNGCDLIDVISPVYRRGYE